MCEKLPTYRSYLEHNLPEHGSSEDVPDGPVGRPPHLLELELLHAVLVGRDRRALDAHVVLQHRVRRVHGHLINMSCDMSK